jgi:integrase
VLRILAVCGLRAAEILVLRIEDFEGTQLRIDEALKERQWGADRIGNTKTKESDNYVPVPPDLAREIEAWIAGHPDHDDSRAFLFPNSNGTAFSVGNYLKRHLKPLAERAGVRDLTHQAFRRTSSTHMQNHGTVKDMQAPPPAHGPQDYSEALCEGDPRKLTCGCRCSGCADYWRTGQAQATPFGITHS